MLTRMRLPFSLSQTLQLPSRMSANFAQLVCHGPPMSLHPTRRSQQQLAPQHQLQHQPREELPRQPQRLLLLQLLLVLNQICPSKEIGVTLLLWRS